MYPAIDASMITVLSTLAIIIGMQCEISYAKTGEELQYVEPEVDYYDEPEAAPEDQPIVSTEPELEQLSLLLTAVLQEPWGPRGIPMLYVEDGPPQAVEQAPPEAYGIDTPGKRSRYYRRYPWKRQNSRSRPYEADNRYMCQPSREDVFKLLVALHETRTGNGGKSINFCNRRRSAGAIFTNIRFLGRRK